MVSFTSKDEMLANVYDACDLLINVFRETDTFEVYEENGLDDIRRTILVLQEVMSLIADNEV